MSRPSHYFGGITPGGPPESGGGPSDGTPDSISFVDRDDVGLSTLITAGTITPTGYDIPISFTFDAGECRVAGLTWVNTSPVTLNPGDSVQIRRTSSASINTPLTISGTAGGVAYTWTVTTGDGTETFQTLEATDLQYLGVHRLDQSVSGTLAFAGHNIGYRRTGAGEWDINVFISGNGNDNGPVHEWSLSNSAPSTTISTAPIATHVKAWGNINAGRTPTGTDGAVMWGGNAYIPVTSTTGYLIQSHGNNYTASGYPNITIHLLNHAAGGSVTGTWGPFQVGCGSEMSRGGIVQIPQDIADEFFDGKTLCFSGYIKSGIATKPHGLNMEHWAWVDPSTLHEATDVNDTEIAIPTQVSARFDAAHPQSRDTRYKLCGWTVAYDCAQGSYTQQGTPVFNGPNPGAIEADSMQCYVVVQTQGLATNKRGVIGFGTLLRKPNAGYTFPGDAQGEPHGWYGNDSGGPPECCHGQTDFPWGGTTGPGAAHRQAMGWIWPISTIASAYNAAISPWQVVTSTDAFEMSDLHAEFAVGAVYDHILGTQAWLDEQTNRILFTYMLADPNNPGYGSPMVAFIQIS